MAGGAKGETGRQAAWRKRNPWARFVEWARRRCNDMDEDGPNHDHYYAKGIRCHLYAAQLKEIWDRDEAWKLKRASLDRKDSRFDYANWNVRFIEYWDNVRGPHMKKTVAEPEPVPEFT